MSLDVTGYRASEHPREIIDSALVALVFSNGNCAQAAKRLNEEHGTNVADTTITAWRNKYQERYLQIREEIEPQVRATLAARHEDSALKALDKANQALEAIDIIKTPPADLGKITQQLAVSSGIWTDKASALRGRPTEITEHRHALEIVTKLRTVSPGLIVDGTAEEEDIEQLEGSTAAGRESQSQRA